MEILMEFLGVLPEILLDLGLSNDNILCMKQKDLEKYSSEQGMGVLSIRDRLVNMPMQRRKQLVLFTRISFILMFLGMVGIIFVTAALMESISGWFFLLGLIAEIAVFVIGYQLWKRKLLTMTS